MNKDRNNWERRRRSFDEENFAPSRSSDTRGPSSGGFVPRTPVPMGPEVSATVKWFKSDKGFGFVTCDDGTGDAFLPGRAVEAAGYSTLEPGTTLRIKVGQGQKGAQVTEIVSVDTSTAEAPRAGAGAGGFAPRRDRDDFRGGSAGGGGGGGGGFAPRGGGETHSGTVRWYNGEKGFGFVQIDAGGGKDVFVHVSVLQRAGLRDLVEGQKVKVTVVQGQKGPQADAIELED